MTLQEGSSRGKSAWRTWFRVVSIVGAIIVIGLGGLALSWRLGEAEGGESGEARKVWSGRSFVGQVTVSRTPSRSTESAELDSERVWSGYDDWEPAIAADPSSSYIYQMTTRYEGPQPCPSCPLPVLIFRRSSDGGATWEADQFLAQTRKTQNDPQIEVAADGTIYVAWLNDFRPGVKFMKSTDHGQTWTRPIALTTPETEPPWSDKPLLAISRDGRDVYIAFNASDSFVVASHDFGKHFAPPVKTNHDKRYWFHNGGAVAPNGDVYFAAVDYSQDYTGDSQIDVLKSSDGGESWKTTRVDTSREMPGCAWAEGCYLGFLGPSDALAVDAGGTIMLAYNAGDTAGKPEQLYVRTSRDGRDWSARQQVSDDDPKVDNGFPALAAGPSAGDFRLVWQDDRKGSTDRWNTWYRRTTDGGARWSNAKRLSDLSTGAPYKRPGGYFFPYGDYLEIAVDSAGENHIIWGEGSSYTGPGGTWYTRGR